MTMFRLILAGVFSTIGLYLLASAPPRLPDQGLAKATGRTIEAVQLFDAVNTINEAARTIYTRRIVGGGLKAGLKFGEDWADPGVEKGPLPALFLRLTAGRMETKPPRLGLYLGSDAPINKSNLFTEEQAAVFETLKRDRAPAFLTSVNGTQVAMYPDIAMAGACVTCHNDHPDSPKSNWKLNDVMGATTWTLPMGNPGTDQALDTVAALFDAVEEAYQLYLDRAAGFSTPVLIGTDWPDAGLMALPDADTFMAEVRARASGPVLSELLTSNPRTTETSQ